MALHIIGFSGTGCPAHANQAAVTGTVGSAVSKTVGAALGTTAATTTTPWGFSTSTQADAIITRLNQAVVDVGAIETLLNACRVDILANTTLVNRLRTDLVDLELLKGSA